MNPRDQIPSHTFDTEYVNGKRFVLCQHCNQKAERSIVTHLKKIHPHIWKQYVLTFARLRKTGYTAKKIMWYFGRAFSWTVIERELAQVGALPARTVKRTFSPPPKSFALETTTIWSFKNRGNWTVHDSAYRGNWAPEIPRNLIMRFSQQGDWVLDPFLGGGTTAIECFLLGRNCIGLDVHQAAISFSRNKLKRLRARHPSPTKNGNPLIHLYNQDARDMRRVPSASINLVCAHPPYLDIIEYTRSNPSDLSTITDLARYLREFRKVAYEVHRCLVPGGTFCVLVADVRRGGNLIPLGLRMLDLLLDSFDLRDIVIKSQNNCSTGYFYKPKTNGILRISHEYLFILKK